MCSYLVRTAVEAKGVPLDGKLGLLSSNVVLRLADWARLLCTNWVRVQECKSTYLKVAVGCTN